MYNSDIIYQIYCCVVPWLNSNKVKSLFQYSSVFIKRSYGLPKTRRIFSFKYSIVVRWTLGVLENLRVRIYL
jgi:hypothetical protein